jgi:outer membrane protein
MQPDLVAQTCYRRGLSSIGELSQAQLQQTQAEIGSAQAGYEHRLAPSVLRYQAIGSDTWKAITLRSLCSRQCV